MSEIDTSLQQPNLAHLILAAKRYQESFFGALFNYLALLVIMFPNFAIKKSITPPAQFELQCLVCELGQNQQHLVNFLPNRTFTFYGFSTAINWTLAQVLIQNTLRYLLNQQYLLSAQIYIIFKIVKKAGYIKHASVHEG